jgi:hypothetical protein
MVSVVEKIILNKRAGGLRPVLSSQIQNYRTLRRE